MDMNRFYGPDCYTWREVFAILPVKTLSGHRVWLRKIYKRKFWNNDFRIVIEYATLFETLTSP